MKLLIFDLDGVLLKPCGYHRALKETVRLAGISTGFGDVLLTDGQIAQFEALGISSEWHSSALCMSVMLLGKQRKAVRENDNFQPVYLNLEDLFEAIDAQPIKDSPLQRGLSAIERLASESAFPLKFAREIVAQSEFIQCSPTLNWFQEMILGSENYSKTYQKKPQFETESYLKLYDQRLLSEQKSNDVLRWAGTPGNGAAIMTNRPSNGPPGFEGAPDADLGSALAGLADLPLVGFGEISWLATQTGQEARELAKPAWQHALVAILAASGWSVSEESLAYIGQQSNAWQRDDLAYLEGSTITVFEDTSSGMIAVQEAGILLNDIGLQVKVQKMGIAEDTAKQSALAAQGAVVFPDIGQALAGQGIC
jgi:hypothetical protein